MHFHVALKHTATRAVSVHVPASLACQAAFFKQVPPLLCVTGVMPTSHLGCVVVLRLLLCSQADALLFDSLLCAARGVETVDPTDPTSVLHSDALTAVNANIAVLAQCQRWCDVLFAQRTAHALLGSADVVPLFTQYRIDVDDEYELSQSPLSALLTVAIDSLRCDNVGHSCCQPVSQCGHC